jgi:hypothetical protein
MFLAAPFEYSSIAQMGDLSTRFSPLHFFSSEKAKVTAKNT